MSFRSMPLALLLTLLSVPALSGEMIVRSFSAADSPGDRVLEHVTEKAVVAEFLDPIDTGIGKSLATLLWRETLTAISDQAGAGVILARAPDGERLVNLLQQDYHQAALRIAEFQHGRMAMWGAALEQSGTIFINTHLSLVPATRSHVIDFKINDRANNRRSQGSVSVVLPRTKFNFSTIVVDREYLFGRVIMTRAATSIHTQPDGGSTELARIAGKTALNAIDMKGDWFQVALEDGSTGWVRGSLVDVPPRNVRVDKSAINLRSSPTTRSKNIITNTDVRGIFPVLQQQYTPGTGLWYQIALNGQPVWVASFLTEPVFSLPVVHFIAGLYRYHGGRYKDAVREFQRFIDFPGIEQDNVNLSTAYQYQALAKLLDGASTQSTVATLNKAMMQTPYDSTPYQIQALSYMGEPRWSDQLKSSLDRAIVLDPRQKQPGQFVEVMRRETQLTTPETVRGLRVE